MKEQKKGLIYKGLFWPLYGGGTLQLQDFHERPYGRNIPDPPCGEERCRRLRRI